MYYDTIVLSYTRTIFCCYCSLKTHFFKVWKCYNSLNVNFSVKLINLVLKGYLVKVEMTFSNGSALSEIIPTIGTSYTISNLLPGTTYSVSVASQRDNGATTSSYTDPVLYRKSKQMF